MAKNDKSTAVQSSRDASSNPEILRDRINELMTHLEIAQRQCIESRDKIAEQQKQFSAMEAHIGSLCKQRDDRLAAMEKVAHAPVDLRPAIEGIIREQRGSFDGDAGLMKVMLATMKSVSALRNETGHGRDSALEKLIAEANADMARQE